MNSIKFIVKYMDDEFYISTAEVKAGASETCVAIKENGKKVIKVTAEIKREKEGKLLITIRISEGTKEGHKTNWSEIACPIINKLCDKVPTYIKYGTVPTEVEGREFKFESNEIAGYKK